ncbi:DDHD domain-containing protein [Xylariales sp. PMI_506]|nr:DDHD domain-containing protein [Xylariales sp. PMI_506]
MAPVPGNSTGGLGEKKKTDKKPEKSYLASAVDSINPWTASRSSTPTPRDKEMPPPPKSSAQPSKPADDHSVTTLYGQSFRRYPPDCPPLNVQWFHAVDIPKRKPQYLKTQKEKEESKVSAPKKFSAFSGEDTRSIENAYQKLLEELEDGRGKTSATNQAHPSSSRSRATSWNQQQNIDIDSDGTGDRRGVRVPVNEDFLFDVDIEQRELAPVYWLGSVYEVRRGSWFYQEGSTLRPCEENLAAQLEEGYLKIKPWTYPTTRSRSNSGALQNITPKASKDNLRGLANASPAEASVKFTPSQPQAYRLFGTYMNSVATYQDSTTAWLTTDSVLSWVTSTVYQRFSGGGYMSGVKLVRGYSEPGKPKDEKRPPTPTQATLSQDDTSMRDQRSLKRRSAPPLARADSSTKIRNEDEEIVSEIERHESQLKRQFSNYIGATESPEKQEEQIRKREEQEIQDDYNAQAGETQGRDIQHLVLVTHGIGQLLGLRMESVNFVHDVNVLRKTLKGVYTHSEDLRALNSEIGGGPGNCKVQVLPVCWRHLLDFPKRREKKGERDLGTTAMDEEDEYPSLEDITIEGVTFARSLISDLALDVLLYQSAYREQIVEIVLQESNRIAKLFLERNPEFKGKIHIMGHSLGSAIMFDILCRQKEKPRDEDHLRNPLRFWPSAPDKPDQHRKDSQGLAFDFDVEDFYCLGSPVGLFQMLKGRTIAARHLPDSKPSESPLNPEMMADPFLAASHSSERLSTITGLPFSISSPKVSQIFNIFHPSDPISYRMEPLISPAMSSLKPQLLPYTKKGIFNAVAPQGLSGIGMKVGQSVSGLWSSISGGIASSILNRSLGLTNEDVANFTAANSAPATPPFSAETNSAAGGGVISDPSSAQTKAQLSEARKKALAAQKNALSASGLRAGSAGSENATLIDDDLETLFSNFQKRRVEAASRADDSQALGDAWAAEEARAQKLRWEEMKVRALNRNGRVDYSIQESVLDFNPINTIASHMSYWQDEDVSHFILSQLLSSKSKRETKR